MTVRSLSECNLNVGKTLVLSLDLFTTVSNYYNTVCM